MNEHDNCNLKTKESLSSTNQVLELIKQVFDSESIKNDDCISVYDVFGVIHQKYRDYNKLINDFRWNNHVHAQNIVFDFKNKELKFYSLYAKVCYVSFAKKEGDLCIKYDNHHPFDKSAETLLLESGKEISRLYDQHFKYEGFLTDQKNGYTSAKESVNSFFFINISADLISISLLPFYDFNLSVSIEDGSYKYNCNSYNVISTLNGNEAQFFKRIFIKINDCPEWTRATLYEIRKNQLEKERRAEEARQLERQKIEEEKKAQEMKMQKRLALRRKIFPFIKK